MKKVLSLLVLLIVVLLMLVGCSEKNDLNDKKHVRNYDDFRRQFNEKISELQEYTIVQLEDVSLEDNVTCHVFYIQHALLDETYRLRVDSDERNEVTYVLLSAEREKYGNLQFAVFALYVYDSMGLPEIEADDFYDKYDLFSKEEIHESDMCEGYDISSMALDATNEITFSIGISDDK